jgi:hypothetical protein
MDLNDPELEHLSTSLDRRLFLPYDPGYDRERG